MNTEETRKDLENVFKENIRITFDLYPDGSNGRDLPNAQIHESFLNAILEWHTKDKHQALRDLAKKLEIKSLSELEPLTPIDKDWKWNTIQVTQATYQLIDQFNRRIKKSLQGGK